MSLLLVVILFTIVFHSSDSVDSVLGIPLSHLPSADLNQQRTFMNQLQSINKCSDIDSKTTTHVNHSGFIYRHEHNSWDKVRSSGIWSYLRCRQCEARWKVANNLCAYLKKTGILNLNQKKLNRTQREQVHGILNVSIKTAVKLRNPNRPFPINPHKFVPSNPTNISERRSLSLSGTLYQHDPYKLPTPIRWTYSDSHSNYRKIGQQTNAKTQSWELENCSSWPRSTTSINVCEINYQHIHND